MPCVYYKSFLFWLLQWRLFPTSCERGNHLPQFFQLILSSAVWSFVSLTCTQILDQKLEETPLASGASALGSHLFLQLSWTACRAALASLCSAVSGGGCWTPSVPWSALQLINCSNQQPGGSLRAHPLSSSSSRDHVLQGLLSHIF